MIACLWSLREICTWTPAPPTSIPCKTVSPYPTASPATPAGLGSVLVTHILVSICPILSDGDGGPLYDQPRFRIALRKSIQHLGWSPWASGHICRHGGVCTDCDRRVHFLKDRSAGGEAGAQWGQETLSFWVKVVIRSQCDGPASHTIISGGADNTLQTALYSIS